MCKNFKITCASCTTEFKPNQAQATMLGNMINKGQTFAMLSCPNCLQSFPINPNTLQTPVTNISEQLPCPACADGIVCYINTSDEAFWGCGACGNVWENKPN